MTAMTPQDAAVETYDQLAEDIGLLGDQMDLVGAAIMAQECRQFAYIAWRAARAEHNPPPIEDEPYKLCCSTCSTYLVRVRR